MREVRRHVARQAAVVVAQGLLRTGVVLNSSLVEGLLFLLLLVHNLERLYEDRGLLVIELS